MPFMSKLIRINPADNVYVVCSSIVPGDSEDLNGIQITFDIALGLGHKIAAGPILKGEKIIKFGVPIGSASMDIPLGSHVHLHNLKSDYLSTYTLTNEFIQTK
jgi:hypothetical protein